MTALLEQALEHPELNKWHDESGHNSHHHPHLTLFESLEEYFHHALMVVAHPVLYLREIRNEQVLVQLLKKVPASLNEKIQKTVEMAKREADFSEDSYLVKIKHLKSIIAYVNSTISTLSEEIASKIDSPKWSWLELGPLIGNPSSIIQYVTRVPLFVHMVSAVVCLLASSVYHLFKDLNEGCNHFLARMDYAGISILVAGSNTPPLYYSFFCDELATLRYTYLGLMYFFCFSCFVLLLVPHFDKPQFIPLRGSLFIIIGLLGGLPIAHAEWFIPQVYLQDFKSGPWGLGGALYILGAVFYIFKFPEKYWPRKFD
eukprot:CAMPEP_0202966348 /NCGR_PEP_ID=MMETSP1396-20130829/10701_1 /ASSEMBLY_ACC=CAM_ASM_000872 /TAXON_ID= /ORGANISM="Pseudokeronopsis sp., Strain Brazil" /LENGTH=314 /DNA_ID=CAMNT_0049690073 /DNA_START=188 /DNA_END=1128 /DNA_ORIENTATION=-